MPSDDTGATWARIATMLRSTNLVLAAAALFSYIAVALLRWSHPFELEWMEGAMLEHMRRVMHGDAIYVPPSIEFVPFLYPPLYYYISAAFATVLGPGFLALRTVSFVASLACFFLIGRIVLRETGSAYASVIAAGIFAAAFHVSGAWYDIGRVDTLFLALVLGGVYLVQRAARPWEQAPAAALFVLAFLTKQSALVVAAPLLAYLLITNWRAGLVFGSTLAAIAGGAVLLLNQLTDGWFLFYTSYLPRQHALLPHMLVEFWTGDLARPMPVALAAAIILLAYLAWREPRRALFLGAIAAGGTGAAWLSRLHSGGWINVVMPAYAAGAILLGVAIHRTLVATGHAAPRYRAALQSVVLVAVAGQFALLAYNPLRQVPTARDATAGQQLLSAIAEVPGSVFVPGHGYLAMAAGKPSFAHAMAMSDVLRAGDTPAKRMLAEDFAQTLAERRFDSIIMDAGFRPPCAPRNEDRITDINWFCDDIVDNYMEVRTLIDEPDVFWPVTGTPRRPERLYVRISP